MRNLLSRIVSAAAEVAALTAETLRQFIYPETYEDINEEDHDA